MNNLSKAAEILKTSWCTDAWRRTLPEGTTFCSGGALMEAMGLIKDIPVEAELDDFASDFETAIATIADSPEVSTLAEVIVEQYPKIDGQVLWGNTDMDKIIHFNDSVANDSDEVVAVFEKAALRFDERV